MKLNKIRMFLVAALFVGVAFFMTKSTGVSAQTVGRNAIGGRVFGDNTEDVTEEGTEKNVTVLSDTSGVPELDNAAERTNKLINWVCGWIGGIMALFGFIWAAMNQAGHNTESRNMGIIVGVIGVVIAFAPSIVKWILGK
ncbi:hypothetical protein SAMN04487934_11634 [Eubacterium ruminantium]|nr:hypothetical protein SAMN04487934_11634 [Eubacterium ruminantium]